MNLRVSPDLDTIVAAAKEAQIAIRDINFIRDVNASDDVLAALSIMIEGSDDAMGYFAWLLAESNLKTEPVG